MAKVKADMEKAKKERESKGTSDQIDEEDRKEFFWPTMLQD